MLIIVGMKRAALVLAVILLYILHQDIWFWNTPRIFGVIPFGVIPIGLFYHGCFSVAASLLMYALVRFAWPSRLEQEIEGGESGEGQN